MVEELERRVKAAEAENQGLREAAHRLRDDKHGLQAQLAEQARLLKRVERANSALRDKAGDLRAKIAAGRKERRQLLVEAKAAARGHTDIEKLKAEIVRLRALLASKTGDPAHSTAADTALEEEVANARTDQVDAAAQQVTHDLSDTRQVLLAALAELDRASAQRAVSGAETAQATAGSPSSHFAVQVRALLDELAEAQSRVEVLSATNADVSAALEHANHSIKELRPRLEDALQEIGRHDRDLEVERHGLQAGASQGAAMRRKVDSQARTIEAFVADKAKLEADGSARQHALKTYAEFFVEAMREQGQLREQVATSTAALEALERERQQAAADCAALRSRCDQLRTELEARDQQIAALLAEKSGAESTASALQAQLADATSQCATLEQDMQDLRYGFSAVATEKDARIERQDGVLGDLTRQRDALQAELARLQQSE